MDWLLFFSLVAIALLVCWLVRLGHQILDTLRQIATQLRGWPPGGHHPPRPLTNYCTWTYRGDAWELVESRVELGFVAGDSPRRPGAYDGETVRRPAVRGE